MTSKILKTKFNSEVVEPNCFLKTQQREPRLASLIGK